jgi:hypothetical protein
MGLNIDRLRQVWATTIERADAFVIVVADDHPGYPGALKNAIDWAATEWAGKPVAFVTLGSDTVPDVAQVMAALHAIAVAPALGLHFQGASVETGFETSKADEARLSELFHELMRQQAAAVPQRQHKPSKPWAGLRVQVIGLDPEVNQGIIAPLRAAGFDAHGLIYDKTAPPPDGRGFDLLAGGGGTAGKPIEAIRAEVRRYDPDKPVIQVLAPVAIRQIISACDPITPKFAVQDVELTAGHFFAHISGEKGRIGVTAFERVGMTSAFRSHLLAQVHLRESIDLALDLPTQCMFLVIDLDGVAFWQQRIPEPI